MRSILVQIVWLGVLGCDSAANPSLPDVVSPQIRENLADDAAPWTDTPEMPIGEAESAFVFSRGTACKAACAIAAGATCGAVATACSGAVAITIGGAVIPCSMAMVAACYVGGPAGAAICMEQCPK